MVKSEKVSGINQVAVGAVLFGNRDRDIWDGSKGEGDMGSDTWIFLMVSLMSFIIFFLNN